MMDLWLKQHGKGERRLAKDMAAYFSDQVKRIAADLADLKSPTAADAEQLLQADDEHAALIEVVKPHLYQLAQVGALSEVKRAADRKSYSPRWTKGKIIIDGQTEFEFATELSQTLVDSIQSFVGDITKRPYWREIQDATKRKVGSIISAGLEDGLTSREMAKQLQAEMSGLSKARSIAIARTETTGAMNGGHLVGMEDLASDGSISGKTWLTIVDGSERESHGQLSDTTVKVTEDFNVGGESAPYPGHASLSAAERINCRCTIISQFPEE